MFVFAKLRVNLNDPKLDIREIWWARNSKFLILQRPARNMKHNWLFLTFARVHWAVLTTEKLQDTAQISYSVLLVTSISLSWALNVNHHFCRNIWAYSFTWLIFATLLQCSMIHWFGMWISFFYIPWSIFSL